MLRYRIARKIIKNLKAGVGIYNSCQSAGTTPSTFWRWRQKSQKFEAFVRRTLDARTQLVEDAMYQAALKGNVSAQTFWLKNKAGWKDSPAILLSTGPNINTPHAIIFSAVKEECIQAPVKDECLLKRI